MLISYKITNGIAMSTWEIGSVPGDKNAAKIIITMIECLLYFLIIFGVSIPSFERKKEIIGSSKINPAASIILRTIETYSSIENSFLIVFVPKPAAKSITVGSIIKYANISPVIKHKDEKTTIASMYLLSFFRSAGAINFHNCRKRFGILTIIPHIIATSKYRKTCPKGLRFCRLAPTFFAGSKRMKSIIYSIKIPQIIAPTAIPIMA